jgi:hypothetical protein
VQRYGIKVVYFVLLKHAWPHSRIA